jgi:cytochrome c553
MSKPIFGAGMSCRRIAIAVAALTLGVLGSHAPAFAAGDAARGKEISYTCLGCHGIEGYKNAYPDYSVPRLAGQSAPYIVAALKQYKSGERAHPTMRVQGSALSDQDMEDIGVYFASLETLKPGGTGNGTAPTKVTELCRACHGKDGVGTTGQFPTLAGQHVDYLERALTEYQRGERKNAIMAAFAPRLTAEDIVQISEYYGQQQPGVKVLPRTVSAF